MATTLFSSAKRRRTVGIPIAPRHAEYLGNVNSNALVALGRATLMEH